MNDFLRRGRGLSFHEFELALKPRNELEVISCMTLFHRDRSVAEQTAWRNSMDGVYEMVLAKACPDVHKGFLQIHLNLIIRKN